MPKPKTPSVKPTPEPASADHAFTASEEHLVQAIGMARMSATILESSGAPEWAVETRYILDAIWSAIYGIRYEKIGPFSGPLPDAKLSASFLTEVYKLASKFSASTRYNQQRYGRTQKKEFRAMLIEQMAAFDQPFYADRWCRAHYEYIAYLLSMGTAIFPSIAKRDFKSLVAKLHDDLGDNFLKKTPEPEDRAHEVLRSAGVKDAWGFIFDAGRKRTARSSAR